MSCQADSPGERYCHYQAAATYEHAAEVHELAVGEGLADAAAHRRVAVREREVACRASLRVLHLDPDCGSHRLDAGRERGQTTQTTNGSHLYGAPTQIREPP